MKMKMIVLATAISAATALMFDGHIAHGTQSGPAVTGTDTSAATAADLFTALRGQWSCTGAFANHQPLAADLTFTPAMDGKLLRFRHADRGSTSYVQEATWGMSVTQHQIVSLAYSASTAKAPPEPALFVANDWTSRSLTLVADTLESPPWAPNRFTYTLAAQDTLKMLWEVERGGAWRMGDSLTCNRVGAHQ